MRPTFVNEDGTESDSIRVIGARHPCVELQDDVEYIPNDYVLEREGSRLMLVTGPNMGGKSTYIRALGAIAVMAQVGSFVPASEARLCVLEMVLARVGASDATQRGISTFMAEMIDASAILASATSRSLVIIDELGRGTSTFDGFGLAWSISEYLLKRTRCFTLFATHYHELTQLDREQGCDGDQRLRKSLVLLPSPILAFHPHHLLFLVVVFLLHLISLFPCLIFLRSTRADSAGVENPRVWVGCMLVF